MKSSAFIAASAAVILLLALVHLLYTFRGPMLHPRDPDLTARMMAVSPVTTGETTMWRASAGKQANRASEDVQNQKREPHASTSSQHSMRSRCRKMMRALRRQSFSVEERLRQQYLAASLDEEMLIFSEQKEHQPPCQDSIEGSIEHSRVFSSTSLPMRIRVYCSL